jgi:hypothetical protein
VEETEISRAVRADADAAREEIRAAGITCPSCGVNMADLPRGHNLPIPPDFGAPGCTVKCNYGAPACPVGYEAFKAAANVSLWGDMNRAMDAEFSKMLGWDISGPMPEPKFTGFPGVLKSPGAGTTPPGTAVP